MRTYSSPESVHSGEIALLAIAETITAIAIYIAVAIEFQTVIHVVIPVTLAPLFLLRTSQSIHWALEKYNYIGNAILTYQAADSIFPAFIYERLLMPALLVLSALAIRATSTVYWLAKSPRQALRAIPENWYKQTFCLDSAHPPELLPNEAHEVQKDKKNLTLFSMISRVDGSGYYSTWEPFSLLPFVFPFLPAYLFAFIYRLTFKATSIIYFPLVWVTQISLNDKRSVDTRLQRVKDSEIEKARRAIAIVLLPAIALKFAVYLGAITIDEALDKLIVKSAGQSVMSASSWPMWSLGVMLEVALSFALLFFADEAIARSKSSDAWAAPRVLLTLDALVVSRSSIAVALVWYALIVVLTRYFSATAA